MLKVIKLVVCNNCARFFQTTATLKGGYTLKWSPNAQLNKQVLEKYLNLPIPECLSIVKYVWVDGTGRRVRCRSRTLDYTPACAFDIPKWHFNGSFTHQAKEPNADMTLVPIAMYNDPFRMGNCRLCLCEVYDFEGKPANTNNRVTCHEALKAVCDQDVWFGFEQEFTFVDQNKRPFGWPEAMGYTRPKGPFYCCVGSDRAFCRDIMESFYRCCLYAGVYVSATNSQVVPSRWEFKVGPSQGIRSADDLWMARFLLHRVAEEFGVGISFNTKPSKYWKGVSLHTGMSTCATRTDGGLKLIEDFIKKLEATHKEDVKKYCGRKGKDNKKRGSYKEFSSGVESRKFAVRIPRRVAEEQKGYLEDRRPASNADPYAVSEVLTNRCLK